MCTRNKTKARQIDSAYLSPCKHDKMDVNTVRIQNQSESNEEDSVGLNEIPRRRDCQNEINVISSNNNLPVIR